MSFYLSPAQDSDTATSARSNFSVIPARVSGAREESRIPLEDVGKDRDSSRGSHARE